MFTRYFPVRSLLAMFTLSGGSALAICTPTPHYVFVGTDGQCDTTSIQTAIDSVVCPGTTVVVTSELTYTSQHLSIQNASVKIAGSAGVCDSTPPICDPNLGCGGGGAPARIAIGGDGVNPVFALSGSAHVTLANLDISGGKGSATLLYGGGGVAFDASAGALTLNNIKLHDNTGGFGGGVAFYGDGTLTITGSQIVSNDASTYGGAISAISSSIGHVDLVIADNPAIATEIASNHARQLGGGIYADGNTHLRAVAATTGRITIHDNGAGDPANGVFGGGGGIAYSGAGYADIALPGDSIHANHAGFGAGILVSPTNDNDAVLRVFSTNANAPTVLYGNAADDYGGGILLTSGSSTHATACLFDAAIVDNSAVYEGAAVDVEDGGRLQVNPEGSSECDYAAVAALGAVHCDPTNINCNRIGLNQTSNAAGAIEFHGAARVAVRRVHLAINQVPNAILGQDLSGGGVTFSDCLVDHNIVSGSLIALHGGPAAFDGCTFAADSIGGGTVFAFDSGLDLTRSIVDENVQVLDPMAAGLTAQYLILNNPKLPTDSTVVYVDPAFVDPASENFHLQLTSPAIDFAPTGAESGSTDLDGHPREGDLGSVDNLFGARDLGAYEYPLPDAIFDDGFEPIME